jgi:hypothetical protein
MASGLRVFRLRPEGSVLATEIFVGRDGAARFVPGDEYYADIYDLIGQGVILPVQREAVLPTDGEAFITAVEVMLSRSSVWGTGPID